MKFPSLKNLAEGAVSTIKRYPFEVLFALAGTIAATTQIELRQIARENEGWCVRVMMIANLGLLLSLSATLYTQSVAMAKSKSLVLKVIVAIFAALLILIIDPTHRSADYTRFFLMSLAMHLLVAFAAFTGKGQLQGFWQFNKTLFLRFLTSVLYGVVLFAGLAAAIGATNFLFNFKFEWDTYAVLWAWIVGMFTTLFFLAGVPVDTHALNTDESYPKGLKIFTQYVLIPLSTVYVIILLAYEIKILVQWNLPKGLVSNLILGYAVFGLLSLLLVYPIREHAENKWLKTYSRSFYFLLLPLLLLLFVAVGARVFSYGITEYRYFLIVLACWLLFISVYFLLFKKQNIKLIPISLSVLTLLSIYGPQSAFTVSMYSQRRVVVKFFEKHNAFKNGKITFVDSTKISNKEGSSGVANLQYFINKYDIVSLQPYFTRNLQKISDSLGKVKDKPIGEREITRYALYDEKLEWIKKQVGLSHFYPYYSPSQDTVADFYRFTANENITVVKGYDIILSNDNSVDTVINNYNGIKIMQTNLNDHVHILKLNGEVFRFDVSELAKKLLADSAKLKTYKLPSDRYNTEKQYSLPTTMLSLSQETPRYRVLFLVKNCDVNAADKKKLSVNSSFGNYLIQQK
ncbi:protein of unknown function [Mucilaginibacter pineti]|uniref:DUF4153 domain-containing protein n=1 Tax=Mucilaginibacter pineti TaxID=1391627 RepID=A0A1G7ALM7_9SPHI|nr:DUF4153 domain-containing protein [Mucilaginibacter pineti]SDE15377.1 protein of unknown function [Mucilaginibacter pineti]